jgi:hypothetical protein
MRIVLAEAFEPALAQELCGDLVAACARASAGLSAA